MRVLVLGAGLVQLALYGAPAPATAAPSPAVLRATEEQRLSTPAPAQTAILSHPQIHPVKAAAPNPGPVPQVAGPVAPEATRMPFVTRSAVARPCEAARARLARAPPAA